MNIQNLSLADLYALYWHFCDMISYKGEPDSNYAEDPSIIYEACRKELDKRLTAIHNNIVANDPNTSHKELPKS